MLERIEARIDEIEHEIVSLGPLVHERARLLRAQAVIRGEPEPLLGRPSARRLTRDDVFDYLVRNPGSRAGEVAAALGVERGAVSAHLHRGEDRLFSRHAGRWYPVPAGGDGRSDP